MPDAAVAQSMSDVHAFWGVRDACAEFYQQQVIGPHLAFDIGLPVDAMDALPRRVQGRARRAHSRLPERVLRPHRRRQHAFAGLGCRARAEQPEDAVDEVVYELVRRHHGTVSAEHGIGTLKKRWLGHARTPEQIALMRTLKHALDPQNLLNPGKVI